MNSPRFNKRIMIIGCGGSGKSTLAKELHQITNIELIHLDQLFFKANWEECEKDVWEEKVINQARKGSWIIDGNYGGTMDIRLQKADTVIFLDRSRWICLFRVLKRTFTNYGKVRDDVAPGCREQFSFQFLIYIFHYNDSRRLEILKKLQAVENVKEVFCLTNNRSISKIIEEFKKRSVLHSDCSS